MHNSYHQSWSSVFYWWHPDKTWIKIIVLAIYFVADTLMHSVNPPLYIHRVKIWQCCINNALNEFEYFINNSYSYRLLSDTMTIVILLNAWFDNSSTTQPERKSKMATSRSCKVQLSQYLPAISRLTKLQYILFPFIWCVSTLRSYCACCGSNCSFA